MPRAVVQRSAGGVVFREREGEMWVVLVATRGGSIWGLPKGLIERGEKPLQTALREVKEETGLQGELVADLGYIEYWYRDSATKILYHKFVDYYMLSEAGGDVQQHDSEIEEARWFPIDDALTTISYDNERDVVSRAKERWSNVGTDSS